MSWVRPVTPDPGNRSLSSDPSIYLALLDWRRRVADLYAELRRRPPGADTLRWFRAEKDALYRSHAQSPLPSDQRPGFAGLHYWPFDRAARVEARFVEEVEEDASLPVSTDEAMRFSRVGWLDFDLFGQPFRLGAYWIRGYAGGLFVPFLDQTSGHETYGGGRYLLDTIKSADLGSDADARSVVLDFNYAYFPSCAYDARWACPLAPPANRLPVTIRAGERSPLLSSEDASVPGAAAVPAASRPG